MWRAVFSDAHVYRRREWKGMPSARGNALRPPFVTVAKKRKL